MDSRELSLSILDALNDIDDKYIAHAGQVKPRRMVSLRSVLIAAVVAMLVVASAIAAYSAKTYSYDIGYQEPTDDPVESVINLLENRYLMQNIVKVEIYGAIIDEDETARVLSEETEIVSAQSWVEDNFVVVYAEYYEESYTILTDEVRGYQANWFWMEYDPASDVWVLYESTSSLSEYSPEYRGLFDEEGVGHEGWSKDDVASRNAAVTYLEEMLDESYVTDFEILGCQIDEAKTNMAISNNYELSNSRKWYSYFIMNLYNFAVYYGEYYVCYDESLTDLESGYYAVWLWMEKDSGTSEWKCIDADLNEVFEYVFITYSEVSETGLIPGENAVGAALYWLTENSMENGSKLAIYGATINYYQTETVLSLNTATAYFRNWSLDERTFLVVYVEYNLDGEDKAMYIWIEKNEETEEWSYYFSVETHPEGLYA